MSNQDRLPHEESSRAIEAFELYYHLGTDRSLDKLNVWYKTHAKDGLHNGEKIPARSTLRNWSVAWKWQERCKKRDAEEIAARLARQREKKQQALDKLNEDQASIAQSLWVKTSKVLLERLEKGDIQPRDAVALLKEAWAVHRLATGAATERIENQLSAANGEAGNLQIIASFGIGSIGSSSEEEESKDE